MGPDARCPACGHLAPASARFCPACGAPLAAGFPRSSTGHLPPQTVLHQRYTVVRKLAQGGHSAVYLAEDRLQGGRPVAVKEMRDSGLTAGERETAINGFMREARMLSQLDHPALAHVEEIFVEQQRHYLVMEYVPGRSLEDEMMALQRPIEWERVAQWGLALCDVLTYLHQQQPPIIYRDLKPPNVMLTPDEQIKLIDFGIARWLFPSKTQDTTQLGTDGYAPPEQYSARSEPRSDVYALGASLYHLLTGRVPEAAPLRMNGHPLTPPRAHNPRVPEPIERVVLQAMSLKTLDRFVSAARMREALESTLRQSGRATGHITMGHRPAPTAHTASSGGPAPARAGVAAPPKVAVWPLRVDVGELDTAQQTVVQLDISNRGGGTLGGRAESNLRALSVSPRTIGADTARIEVRIDAGQLAPGPYRCHVAIRTNGGDQIVPIRFTIRPDSGY